MYDGSSNYYPSGAGQPRYMASQPYGDNGGSQPYYNESFAHSQQSMLPGGNASTYNLNENRSYYDDPAAFRDNVALAPVGQNRDLSEKNELYASPKAKSQRKAKIIGALVGFVVIAGAVVAILYFTVIKKKDGTSTSGSAGKNSTTLNVVSGASGSKITMENGTSFTYTNPFGGYWYYDPNDPYKSVARPQEWSPALNETFKYGIDKIRGVNLGGWLNPEPVQPSSAPALYQKYLNNPTPAVDEWTLCENMAQDTAGGGLNQLEEHYKTFITEKDFAEIAAAGLNYIRLPIGYWAIEKRPNEPFLEGVSWTYVLKAIKWARKYGLRINLDLHTMPGSQNGWNHSGKMGKIGFLRGPMGYANAQRALNYIRILAEFISQPQYKDVVTMFGVMNEPLGTDIGKAPLFAFYLEAYNIVRAAGGGTGEGNGPWISMHNGFLGNSDWIGSFTNADRVTLDQHPYLAFSQPNADPMEAFINVPCKAWGQSTNDTQAQFGLYNAGEFSLAVNDCGLFLNEVNGGSRYEGDYIHGASTRIGSCDPWTDYQNYDAQMKASIKSFALSSMDALQNYFFWTWKIGPSAVSGKVETPAWSYQLGLQEGYMPADPREAAGACGNTNPWQPPLQPWMTGGAGAGDIPQTFLASYTWPPTSLTTVGPPAGLPSYTPTGSIITLKPETATTTASGVKITKTADPGSGWNNPKDNAGLYVEIAGCGYLDAYVDPEAAVPALCVQSRDVSRRAPEPVPSPAITPPPTA
ncbi:exo-beta-1,3-glucanase [Ephemerocybe angulata]|uniref:glucan 1,3-beta-glucosidase n=1 Tax=Ephemerocybe angulata TaxID=980116 RepID=A0A8H6M2R7_9AGAR|nr:exo-beta-1,3-glucanase [Tulosesus angulatus]